MRWCALVLLSALALTGCASSGGLAPGGSATPTGSLSGSPLPTATATESPSTFPEREPSDPPYVGQGTVTLSGTVRQGAEPSCLILYSTRGQFELLDPKPVPRDGDQVRVTGHLVKAMSHCMQGQPFFVEKLTIG
jgi:hypothetical protein